MHELIQEVSKYAMKMGEEWRCGEGTEMMDALQSTQDGPILFPRLWAMPSRHTFEMWPVQSLLKDEMTTTWPELETEWVDPFAGFNSPAGLCNDINPEVPCKYHQDALDWLKGFNPKTCGGMLFDPPYSVEQCRRTYKMPYKGTIGFTQYIGACKDEVARIVRPGGKAISFGWDSCGMGIKRGFKLVRGLLICHGNSRKDTIVTVEVKL